MGIGAMASDRRPLPQRIALVMHCLLLGGFLGAAGCKETERPPEVITLEGKIDDIKIRAGGQGEITAVYYNEKHHQEVSGTAQVTGETEILINGAVSDLSHVRKGERVRADVLVDRSGDKQSFRVLKMTIERPTEAAESGG